MICRTWVFLAVFICSIQALCQALDDSTGSVEETNGDTVDTYPTCRSQRECLEILQETRKQRRTAEENAYDLLKQAEEDSAQAAFVQAKMRDTFEAVRSSEDQAVHMGDRVTDLERNLLSLQNRERSSEKGAKDAVEAEQRAAATAEEAVRVKEKWAALAGMSAKDDCSLDLVSCIARLLVGELRDWLQLLALADHFQLALSICSLILGVAILQLPIRIQAVTFGGAALLVLPVLVGGTFKDFVRIMSDASVPLPVLDIAYCGAALLAAWLMWQGSNGLRVLLGAGLALLVGNLLMAVLPGHGSASVASATVGFLGCSLGVALVLVCPRAVQAVSMAVMGGQLFSSGVLLLSAEVLDSALPWDAAMAALLPWATAEVEEATGIHFLWAARTLWLLLVLMSMYRLTKESTDVHFPWEKVHSAEPEKFLQIDEEVSYPDGMHLIDAAAANTGDGVDSHLKDGENATPVEVTGLLLDMVQALQKLREALPPEAAGTADVHHINALTAAIARANQLLHSDPELSELCQSELVAAGGEGCPWLSVYEVVPMVSRMCGSVPVVSNLVQPSREEIKELFAGWAAETSNDGVLQAEFIKSFFKVVLQSCIHETEKRLADITGA